MTTLRLSSTGFEKFLYQNKVELIDAYEGCLLDNYFFTTKNNGAMSIYEHYLNEWNSDYQIYFSRDDQEKRSIEDTFYKRMEEYNKYMEVV